MKFAFPKITIYDRYMFKQVFLTSFVAILLFTIVWVAPEMLLNIIKGALAGEYGVKTAIYLFVCEFEEFRSPLRVPHTQGGGFHGNGILSYFFLSLSSSFLFSSFLLFFFFFFIYSLINM